MRTPVPSRLVPLGELRSPPLLVKLQSRDSLVKPKTRNHDQILETSNRFPETAKPEVPFTTELFAKVEFDKSNLIKMILVHLIFKKIIYSANP